MKRLHSLKMCPWGGVRKGVRGKEHFLCPTRRLLSADIYAYGRGFNGGPLGGRHLGGDSCPPITFDVISYKLIATSEYALRFDDYQESGREASCDM